MNRIGRRARRWGPAVALVALAATGTVIAFVGGGDRDDVGGPPTSGPDAASPAPPAIAFSDAAARGLEVTFPPGCDLETGRIAMPFFFRPECYADQIGAGQTGTPGVTDDRITVVVYLPPENDLVLDFITSAVAVDDTTADVRATYEGYTEMFQALYQTYGRSVELRFLQGSGGSLDEVAARSDAVRAAEDLDAFAVWGGPVLARAWTEEIAARGVVCLACPGGGPDWMEERAPYVYATTANGDQIQRHVVEYVAKQVAGRLAQHSGDPVMRERERVIGHLWLESSAESQGSADELRERLASEGVELAASVPYSLDPARLQEQAVATITRLRDAGVTTVLFTGDPIAPATFTREATAQRWFPEWIVGGSTLVDTTAFARTYDQQQWAHAFGISTLTARSAPESAAAFRLYEWFHGEPPPADDTAPLLFPQPALFFSALQAAGPQLTAETFRDALFEAEPTPAAITQPTISFGNHGLWPYRDWNGIDDATEIWWDPGEAGPDEIGRHGQGMYRYVDGGRRFLPGAWPARETRVFDPDGAVALLDDPPEGEVPPEYPSPR